MGERQNLSSSYVFRPILEPPDHQQHQLQVASGACHPFSSDRLSVNSGGGGTGRKRVNSGGPSPLAANLDASRPTPKLSSCWRATGGGSQDAAWSSQGSRHSSRPGSTTSSRPSSQCCNAPVAASSSAAASAAVPPGSLLYSKSNNSSTSDVSVSKNFQQLTVSTRRAAFRAQKWSHSLDQPCVSSAHTSPGRRRQASLQQKSLDLDSGYRSSTSDLKSAASHSQSSWNNDVACRHPAAFAAGGGGGRGGVCSPISDARQELRELKYELENATAAAAATTAAAAQAAPAATDATSSKDDFISRSASTPSFCCTDGCGGGGGGVGDPQRAKTAAAAGGLKQKVLDASSHHLSVLESVTNLDLADDLDEEIKMIVAQGGISPPGSGDSGGQHCTRRERSPYFQPDMHEVLSLLDDDDDAAAAAANHCPLMPSRGREGLERGCGRGSRRFALGLKHENDDASASGDIVLIVPPHVRRPEPTKQQDHGDGDCVAKQLDFFAAATTVPSGSSDVVLSSNRSQRTPEEKDFLLAKAEHVEDEAAAAAAAGPAKPPLPSQPTTSRRSRLVRSQRIAEVKEEKDDSQPQAHAPKSGRTVR